MGDTANDLELSTVGEVMEWLRQFPADARFTIHEDISSRVEVYIDKEPYESLGTVFVK